MFALIAEHIWSGGKMAENADDTFEKFQSLFGSRARLATALHQIIIGIILFLHYIDVLVLPEASLKVVSMWAAANLIAISVVIVRRRFVTPRIANPLCPNCSAPMATIRLKCESCGWEAGEPK